MNSPSETAHRVSRQPRSTRAVLVLLVAAVAFLMGFVRAPQPEPSYTSYMDIDYVSDAGPKQRLDLYVPQARRGQAPLVVWVHGGGWRMGSKEAIARGGPYSAFRTTLLHAGYAVASVNYRLTPDGAFFPDQIHDVKAAVRYLNIYGPAMGVDATRIVVAGDSAGGNLAMLMGTTVGDPELEGELGVRGRAFGIRGVVSYYGTADQQRIFLDREELGCDRGAPGSLSNQGLLFGGIDPSDPANANIVEPGNPVRRAAPDSVPMLFFHGTSDCVVPHTQALRMAGLLTQAGVENEVVLIEGGHGDTQFYRRPDLQAKLLEFLDRRLGQ